MSLVFTISGFITWLLLVKIYESIYYTFPILPLILAIAILTFKGKNPSMNESSKLMNQHEILGIFFLCIFLFFKRDIQVWF
jgi:hypothetical protein